MKSHRLFALVLFVCLSVALSPFAHSGGTDRYGGHNNRKTGGYHYHNAGSLHAAGNPHQDHTRCGICSTSKKPVPSKDKAQSLTDSDVILALQSGLKCMGYEIKVLDGKMGPETRAALDKFVAGKVGR